MAANGMVKKWKIAPFIDKTPNGDNRTWVRIKKSTAFDLALNPEMQEFDYIADEAPTQELDKYKIALAQSLTMYKGEADYDLIFDYFYNLKVGSDAKTNVLIVFFQENEGTESTPKYKAWESSCVISVNNLNSVDSTLSFDINFGGTVKKGTVTESNGVPVFTENSAAAADDTE